jgi:ADP-ribosylglycohydrolase
MKNIDKYRGCLIGGAAGDALGFPIEFMEEGEIFERYGSEGIQAYQSTGNTPTMQFSGLGQKPRR